MKILFISSKKEDYQSDLLFHGFSKKNLSVDLFNKKEYLYKNYPDNLKSSLYGRGFTYSGLIDSDFGVLVDFKTIKARLKNRYYDLVIFGEIHKCSRFFLRSIVLKNKVIVIDGEDSPYYNGNLKEIILYLIKHITRIRHISKYLIFRCKSKFLFNYHERKLLYFKRELLSYQSAYPINFAIPEEKITTEVSPKVRYMALLNPSVMETYIYTTEKSYYNGYRESYFALTKKKGGWDCLRHYEILANGCIPYFPDLLNCPSKTMTSFPKKDIMELNKMYESFYVDWDLDNWNYYCNKMLRFTKNHLTTERLAEEVLNKINSFYNLD